MRLSRSQPELDLAKEMRTHSKMMFRLINKNRTGKEEMGIVFSGNGIEIHIGHKYKTSGIGP